MSMSEAGKIEGVLDELRNWPSFERLRLARMILETLEGQPESVPARQGSLRHAGRSQDWRTVPERRGMPGDS